MAPRKTTKTAAATAQTEEEAFLDTLDFTTVIVPFDKEHVRLCRKKFQQTPLHEFVGMMRRAKKLDVDPVTDLWQMIDGTFIMRASAMFEYASRTGNYAPGESPAVFVTDEKLIGDTNPEGLVSCVASIKVKTSDGAWHTAYGEAFWKDLVPLTGGKQNAQTGRYEGGWVSDDSGWASMPRVMLRKCAFVDALKKAFPELGSFYVREEMDGTGTQPGVSMSDARSVKAAMPEVSIAPNGVRRARAKGTVPAPVDDVLTKVPTTGVRWSSGAMETIALPQFFDRVSETLTTYGPAEIIRWFEDNLTPREDFWRYDKRVNGGADAVRLKALLDEAKSAPQTGVPTVSLRATPRTRRRVGVSA